MDDITRLDMAALVERALSNDFFLGGAALASVGLALALAGTAWRTAERLVLRWLAVSVEVDNRGPAFRHLSLWLARSGVLAHARRLRVAEFEIDDDDEEITLSSMAPALGRHWFFADGRLCLMEHDRHDKARVNSFDHGTGPLETVTLTVFGAGRVRARRAVAGWLAAGARIEAERTRIGPRLFVLASGHWEAMGEVRRRPLASVAVEGDVLARLVADLRRFLSARDWYAERGVPWRRGYLLHGPPGTGKSSLIRALASELDLGIATIDLGRQGLGDEALRRGMASAPRHVLMAIEDIDAVFVKREGTRQKESGVSFSGLLNAIDGVAAQEGRPLIMTTNHRDRLDPALIRPGRADLHVELGLAGSATAEAMFRRFFPGEDALARRFAAGFGDARRAPAEIQGWLLGHAEDPAAAAAATAFLTGEKAVSRALMAAE
ncbi:MAG: AAA family ATPase [Pseudomonadota bacterium]